MKFAKAISLTFCTFLISAGAVASDSAVSAAGTGPKGVVTEIPSHGGTCSFVYSIQKIGPTLALEGEEITYHVFVRNLGNCRLEEIDVKDRLPRGIRFVSATPAPTFAEDHQIRWEDVTIRAGRYIDFEIHAKVEEPRGDDTTNLACAFTPWIGIDICDSITTDVDDRFKSTSH